MRNSILLGLYLLLISDKTFAQHEHPKMSIPVAKEMDKSIHYNNDKTVKYFPKVVRYDLYVRDTTVILGKKLNEPLL